MAAAEGPDARSAPDGHHEPGLPDVAGLFRERHAELVRLAVLVVGDRTTAEDVVQDVFARLCARDLLPGHDDALAYVRAAVLNGCRSVLRRRALVRRLGGARERDRSDAAPDSAEDEVILAEDRRQVLAALASLPVRRREVLVLRYWLGLSEAEIASVMAISPGTVKSNAARGLVALARRLGEES
jgi:RNA polymerase sigma factor (sigma-70 family)